VLPHDLAYPEVFGEQATWYDGSATQLTRRLRAIVQGELAPTRPSVDRLKTYDWSVRANEMDQALADLAGTTGPG